MAFVDPTACPTGRARRMASILKTSGPKRAVLGASLILGAVTLTGLGVHYLSKPKITYDFLQDHIEYTQSLNTDDWRPQSNPPEKGRTLSNTDHTLMSRILAASEAGRSFWSGRKIVEGQALAAVEAYQTARKSCRASAAPCSFTVRVDRVLTPTHVHGDLRVANIEERSRRIDLVTEPVVEGEAAPLRVLNSVSEVRNLRFVKRRNGWTLRTVETLSATDIPPKELTPAPDGKFVGINYYPASASWRDFWTEFPTKTIETDLATIRALGANSIRIFLTHSEFSQAKAQTRARTRLVEMMDMARVADLKVIVTVFDLRPDYRVENWANDAAFLKQLLPLIEAHPALLALDLKNQIDLDIPSNGAGLITGWIRVMQDAVSQDYPHIPVTVGFSKASAALAYGQDLDIISYHDYDAIDGFASRAAQMRAQYPNRPVWITEIGSTAWSPLGRTVRQERAQTARLKTQLNEAHDLDGVFLWTLTDFDAVGSDVVGWQPWRKQQQAHYGLFDLAGQARPSAKIFSEFSHDFLSKTATPEIFASHSPALRTALAYTPRKPLAQRLILLKGTPQ